MVDFPEVSRKKLPGRLRLLTKSGVLIALCVSVLTGCIPGGKRMNPVYQYALDYRSPSFAGLSRLAAVITFGKFSAAEEYNGLSMVYSPSSFKRDVYNYYRWRVAPGDMIGDYLLRDFRESGLFRAVFSSSEYENGRYMVQGRVGRFLEVDRDGTSKAELSVDVTLLDTTEPDISKEIVFQRSYSVSAPIDERTPEGFAAGMSKAMAKLSAELIKDVYGAVRNRK